MEEELEALRNKNRELLDELKKARAKNADADALQKKLDSAQAEVLELKLHSPVRALLSEVLIEPNKFAIAEVMEDYTFELDDNGNIQMLHDDKSVDFTVEAVAEFLGGVDKYAGVVRAMARNETVETGQQPAQRDGPSAHFGIK